MIGEFGSSATPTPTPTPKDCKPRSFAALLGEVGFSHNTPSVELSIMIPVVSSPVFSTAT